MAESIPFNYTDILNYTISDADKIGLSAGKAVCLLQQDDVDFIEDFADDTDFTYDSDLAEFTSGLVRQKSQYPSSATFGANYNTDINGTFGNGILIGNAIGGASITGNKLDLTGGGKCVNYEADLNADSQQVGTIKFKATPNYTGSPSTDEPLFTICKANGDSDNIIMLRLQSGGQLQIFIQNSTGVVITNVLLGIWNNVQGVEYEFELNYDLTNGATRLFIDGIQFGDTQTDTGIRDSNIAFLNVGGNYNNVQFFNGYIEDFIIFNSVQHTLNYTKGYTIADYKYLENSVVLPEMEKTGDGTIKLFNSLTSAYTGSPRILLEIGRSGDKLYWDGDSWEISDETYDQATDPVTFNTNCDSLDIDGEIYGQFIIVFPDSNILSSFDELTANMNVDIGYADDNPYIEPNTTFRADGLAGFTEVSTKSGSDKIKHILKKNSIWYYHDGNDWVESNETYAQANTAAEIETYKADFLTEGYGKNIKLRSFLHSDDGSTTPALDTITISYNFSGDEATYSTVTIYGYLRNIVEEETGILKIRSHWVTGDKVILTSTFYEETLTDGYFEIPIQYETGNPPDYLEWRFNNKIYKTNFIEQNFVEFGELTVLYENTTNVDLLGT